MTVIAWDGTTLAADRAGNFGGIFFDVTKIRRHEGALLAIAGNGCRLEQLTDWFRSGADPKTYPARLAPDEDSILVVIDRDANWAKDRPLGHGIRIRRFEATGFPIVIDSPLYADGAGRDVAITAMHCGKSAREAVLLACKLTAYCGNGIDVLELPT